MRKFARLFLRVMLINAKRADGVCSGSIRSSHSQCSDSTLSTKQSSLIKAVSELVCSDQGEVIGDFLPQK